MRAALDAGVSFQEAPPLASPGLKPQHALARITTGERLPAAEMLALMRLVLRGDIDEPLVAALLAALRTRGESVEDIAATAAAVRELMIPLPDRAHFLDAVDLCGTGGDGAGTFNVSTAAAFVACAAGARVAKHGNRGVSSACGSADVLEALGADVQLAPAQVAQCVAHTGVGFMFTPNHHPALRRLAPLRKSLGVRTVFNLTGPLCNPAGVGHQLLGVFDAKLAPALARALGRLGTRRALVVHGCDGLDEITITGPTQVTELEGGSLRDYAIDPRRFGMALADASAIRADGARASCRLIGEALSGGRGAARDVVVLNAAGALHASGAARTFAEGVDQAGAAIDSGAAARKLKEFVSFTRQFNH